MNRNWVATAASVILLVPAVFGADGSVRAAGTVCPDPAKPCAGFKPHELSFETPSDEIARSEYRSESFYAIILKTTKPCGVTEEERLKVQALMPNKVFSTRFDCEESFEEMITYTNVNPKFGFIAVYAGATLSQAEQCLAMVKASGQFPGANIRKTQAVLVYP